MSEPDPYKTLQVDPEAEDEVIVAAYRRLARKYHPDVAAGADAAARMAAINAAWERIGEPARRAAYDRERTVSAAMARRDAGPPQPPAATADAAPPRPRRHGRPPRRPRPRRRPATRAGGRLARLDRGRSSVGGGYDPRCAPRTGPGRRARRRATPSGSVLTFGRYAGWSLGEIARADLEYLEWLDRMPIGRPYRDEIDAHPAAHRAPALRRGRGDRPARAVPAPLSRSGRPRADSSGRPGRAADSARPRDRPGQQVRGRRPSSGRPRSSTAPNSPPDSRPAASPRLATTMPTSPRGTIPNPTVAAPQRPSDRAPISRRAALVTTPATARHERPATRSAGRAARRGPAAPP